MVLMKKVCVVTATRSEYGVLRWIIDGIQKDPDLQLQLLVTGAHLSEEFGETYKFVEEDGYVIDEKVDMCLSTRNVYDITYSMGQCAIGISESFRRLQPNMIVVLGDRYELLPIVSTALVQRIPIAHISGGDITEGAIDNEIRNAVSCMSSLHFPGIEESAHNLKRILGCEDNIFTVGEPGLDSFLRCAVLSRDQLAACLGLDVTKRWMLVTLHSETKSSIEDNMQMVHNLYEAMLMQNDVQYIITKANADLGGTQINDFWDIINNEQFRVFASLGQMRYLSIMRQVECLVGNSSSGIIEAPFLGIPVINIGNRQKGRHICRNVCCCTSLTDSILNAFLHLSDYKKADKYWGDGYASERIITQVKMYLNGETPY